MAGEDSKVLSLLEEFVLPPESVQEQFQGLPTLYNPPSVVRNLRKFPIQEAVSRRSGRSSSSSRRYDDGEDESLQESDAYMYNRRESHANLKLSTVIKDLLLDIAYHPGVKYWIAFLAVVIILELGKIITNIIWFGLGAGGVIIISQAVWGPEEDDEESPDSSEAESTEVIGSNSNASTDPRSGLLNSSYWRSQGWMLTLPTLETKNPFPDYESFSFHLRNTKPVFIRLDGPNLLVSFPHPRHHIPKRRLWNDPLISNDIIFIQHQHYNMYGAKVEIVPADLPKKRCWSKKYPISITLACKDRHVGKLTEKVETGNPSETDNKGKSGVKITGKGEKLQGEVHKEEGKCSGKILFLFARTDREKDDWFRRLVAASKRHASHSKSSRSPLNSPDFSNFISYMKHACPTLYIPTTFGTPLSAAAQPNNNNRSTTSTKITFETVLIPNMNPPSNPSPSKNQKKVDNEHVINPSRGLMVPQFLNALLARVFYDFLRSPKWTHEVKQLIDKKLFYLRKPKMVQSLLVKELDLGNSLPVINHASSPVLDRQGLWVDLDITYTGTVVITIEAFINLLNMGKSGHDLESSKTGKPSKKSPFKSEDKLDSDDDDSGESSESESDLDLEEAGKKKSKKESDSQDTRGRIYKYADAIAKSSVMRNKHVQKVVGNLAATPFLLTVEIKHVVGSVAVNIPPVPNDRVWIGFRTNPEIDINAKPKVGQRVVSLSQVTGWIKKKILLEFQRVMVCPNMVDVAIPLMDYELPK